ncbi:hypothetical protein WAF17_02840 [Bernardetia sp. ABR2-2B]|uniref:hypothetical protein n=1 Tax=Bernardetia sp. ABR2-2B TaxID=3127472 RepID=UPI0030D622B9
MNNKKIQITFNRKKSPIPIDYRPLYKISHFALILYYCCIKNKASLVKLHLFAWALKSSKNMAKFEETLDSGIWSLEASVTRALNFGVAEGLFDRKGISFSLTVKGKSFVEQINHLDALHPEKRFLKKIGKSISESKIKTISKHWQ